MMNSHIGQEFGAYRLISLLGRNAYAEVYLGEHRRVQGQAAIKLLTLPSTSWGWTAFQQTCKRASGLVHPRIARVLDFDQQAGTFFLVLEYLSNGPLKQRYAPGTQVPLKIVVDYVQQVAEALHYAHSQSILHLGIKPSNLLLTQQQEIIVSDFGISAFARPLLPPQMSMAAESVAYMAPEQLQGQAGSASDQYALAVCAYQWLREALPFQGNTSEIITGHLSLQPPSLLPHVPGLPTAVEQVLLTALSKDPAARFRSIQAFSQALEQASNQAGRSHSIAPASQRPPSQPGIPATSMPVSPLQSGRASKSVAEDPARSTPVAATPTPFPPTQLAQPQLQTPSGQDQMAYPQYYPPYPQTLPPAPATPLVSRRAMITGALGVGAAGVLTTLCTHTAWLSYLGKSFRSSAGATPTAAPNPLLLSTYRGHSQQPESLVWSPDSAKLVSTERNATSGQKSSHVWDALTGTRVSIFKTPSHGSANWPLDAAVWTSNGGPYTIWMNSVNLLVTTLHITNIINGQDVSTYTSSQGESLSVNNDCHFSPDGKYLAVAEADLLVLNTGTGEKIVTFPHPNGTDITADFAWSPDGQRIAVPYENGIIIIWELSSGTQVSSYQKYVNNSSGLVQGLAWSSDSKRLATIGPSNNNRTIDIWNAQDGKQLYTYTNIDPQDTGLVGWSADNSLFATVLMSDSSGNITVWSDATHKPLRVQQGSESVDKYLRLGNVSWAPNSSRIAGFRRIPDSSGVGFDYVFSTWDAETGQHLTNYIYPEGGTPGLIAWSPNGKYIAASYGYNTGDTVICVWKAT